MITYNRFELDNGLRVLVHEDTATPMAVVNIMYDVGARDENPAQTGFAHLFEHLMFGGSIHIPDYDEPLQRAGGENNAYTTNDLTNYYCQLPAQNLETAFWLESDRMLSLAFTKKSLDVQRKVVCEEFKENYINKPYGDVWHKLRHLAYTTHPYKWMTIGDELSHIENAKLDDVKNFFFRHYRPVNAILVVAGNVKTEEVKRLAEKWFGDIPMGEKYVRNLPQEPKQQQARRLEVEADVPLNALYKAWHMGSRLSKDYYAADLITEVLGGGASSRLHHSLVKQQKLFSNLECYHFGTMEPGLVAIEGKLVKGVKLEDAEKAVEVELNRIKSELVNDTELEKVKNKTESIIAFEDMSVMSRANSLAFYELTGDVELINEELGKYQAITTEDILAHSKEIFDENNSSTLYYNSKN
ncbi:Predicted Zn-dependent peptidase [Filimonas lacunae]|uniref:Predicted Zn-dependent peptidase n=1 Tax=Filimonas lacunae TaxID=477680 RepID=A0A173MPN7_9BACT|nr:pitrilysin family protein [Filimonas lacunae]BAV09612.1 zinc protease [Filimonas lacunae]SIS75918.1 Predicted Zn-dependent peptidase [Filimonas lacunae]